MQQRENLKKLQKWMHANDVQALLVPHEDMFGGEYLAAHDERLAWVSNFNGSAGLAIITCDQAHLFVDGRYTLQAKTQSSHFAIHDLTANAISSVCKTLSTLHYDPWLMSEGQLDTWKTRAKMHALTQNPIDLLWSDRPQPNYKPAFNYPIQYAGVATQEKLKIIYKDLDKHNCTAWFLSNPESVCWLLNIRGEDLLYTPLLQSMALVEKESITLFCEPSKISIELAAQLNLKVSPFKDLPDKLKTLKGKIIADKRTTPSALGIPFNWQTDPCELSKAVKNPIEQQGMRDCHARDAVALMRFWIWLENQESITEMQAQDYLGMCREKIELYRGDSFATISGFGSHGAIVHYRATTKTNIPINKGLYLLDSGGQYLDGTTDITRTFCIGPSTQEQRTHYTLVLKGHIALANAFFPVGTSGAQLDTLARQYLWNHGLDYAHGTGHGVGSFLNVHEGPQGVSRLRNVPLEVGMVVSNEPGLYIENAYGIRIENLQMVKKSKHKNFLCFESLTLVPYEASLIEESLLTQMEMDWLQSYYKNIWTKISPILTRNEQKWLKNKLDQIL